MKLNNKVIPFFLAFIVVLSYSFNRTDDDTGALVEFELGFAKKLLSSSGYPEEDGYIVSLIGYKTINLDETGKAHYKELKDSEEFKKSPNAGHFYVMEDLSSYRIYTFLRDVVIDYRGQKHIGDEKGLFRFDTPVDISDIKVVGRRKTEQTTGGGSDTISGDTIFFKEEFKLSHLYKDERVLVFDLGEIKPNEKFKK
jgi:hypothetical protein